MSNGLPLNAASDDNPEGGSSCDPIEDQSKRPDSKQKTPSQEQRQGRRDRNPGVLPFP